MIMYGLYDTEDGLWMGDETGPLTHSDERVARVLAMVCDRSLRQKPGRTHAKEFVADTVKLHDSKPMFEPAVVALAQLEKGNF